MVLLLLHHVQVSAGTLYANLGKVGLTGQEADAGAHRDRENCLLFSTLAFTAAAAVARSIAALPAPDQHMKWRSTVRCAFCSVLLAWQC